MPRNIRRKTRKSELRRGGRKTKRSKSLLRMKAEELKKKCAKEFLRNSCVPKRKIFTRRQAVWAWVWRSPEESSNRRAGEFGLKTARIILGRNLFFKSRSVVVKKDGKA